MQWFLGNAMNFLLYCWCEFILWIFVIMTTILCSPSITSCAFFWKSQKIPLLLEMRCKGHLQEAAIAKWHGASWQPASLIQLPFRCIIWSPCTMNIVTWMCYHPPFSGSSIPTISSDEDIWIYLFSFLYFPSLQLSLRWLIWACSALCSSGLYCAQETLLLWSFWLEGGGEMQAGCCLFRSHLEDALCPHHICKYGW